jgi:hypothetical protein
MDKLSERRLKENEVIFQQANKGVADFVLEEKGGDPVIKFYCECSNMDCRERIPLRASKYSELHKNKRQFIALNGHEMPKIEKIVSKHEDFSVVEKYGDVPSVEDIDKTLTVIADSV